MRTIVKKLVQRDHVMRMKKVRLVWVLLGMPPTFVRSFWVFSAL